MRSGHCPTFTSGTTKQDIGQQALRFQYALYGRSYAGIIIDGEQRGISLQASRPNPFDVPVVVSMVIALHEFRTWRSIALMYFLPSYVRYLPMARRSMPANPPPTSGPSTGTIA
jgi:hypothetical protein